MEIICYRSTCSMEFVFNGKVVELFPRTSLLFPEEFSG